MMKWMMFVTLVIGWPLYTWFNEYDIREVCEKAFFGFLIFVFLVVPLGNSSGEPIGGG